LCSKLIYEIHTKQAEGHSEELEELQNALAQIAEKLAAQVLAAQAIQSEADGYKAQLQTSTEERVKALEEQRPAQEVKEELESLLRQTQEQLAEKTKFLTHLEQEREREREEGEALQREAFQRSKRERERDTRERLSRKTMEKVEEQLLDLERSFDLLEQAGRASITFEDEPTGRGADITEKTEKIELIKPHRGEADEFRRERGPIAKQVTQLTAAQASLRSLDLMEQFNMLEQITILTEKILNQGHGHVQVRIKAWENAERDRPHIIAERMRECEKWDCERQQYVNRIQEMEQEGEECVAHLEAEIDRLLNKVL